MKKWSKETRVYFKTLSEAKVKAVYENTSYRRFNGIHYDGEIDSYYVSYVYKY